MGCLCVWCGNSEFEHIPLQDYSIEGDSLIYTLYEGESTAPLPKNAFHLAALTVVPTEIQNIKKFDDRFVVEMVNGKKYNVNIAKLSEDILDQQIEQRTFIFGTDLFGRSILDRALLGIRYSLFIGLLAVFISITLGTLIGVIAGYFGGKVDDLLSYIMNVFWSIPTLVLVFAIVLVMGRGIQNIFIAVGLTMWVDAARLARGQVMSVKREKYVEAAKTTGMSTYRIIFRHILPNMLGPLFVIATSNFASAIIIESGLSYLGFGIQPPAPSLGSIISENYGYLMTGKPMLAVIPVLLLLSLVLAFNLVGNGIRDIFDVRSELS